MNDQQRMDEQQEWLEGRIDRIINADTICETELMMQTMRDACEKCFSDTLVEWVRCEHADRTFGLLGRQALARTWAECCALEVIVHRQAYEHAWAVEFYRHELKVMVRRGSPLLGLESSYIAGRGLLRSSVLAACYGELLNVYALERKIFWSIYVKRKVALHCLAERLLPYRN